MEYGSRKASSDVLKPRNIYIQIYQGYENPGSQFAMATNFGSLRLLFAGLQYGTCFMYLSGSWDFDFAAQFLENYVPYSTQYKSYMCLYGCEAIDKVT
jgi:hypothetical protein